jgi:O-antigen ligase
MKWIDFLWILVWLGVYSNIDNFQSPELFDSGLNFIQGIRSFFPLLAVFLCLLKVFVAKHRRIPLFNTPLELLFYYALIAIIVAIISPEAGVSLYWGLLYLSPIIVVWDALNSSEPLKKLQRIIVINYVIFFILVAIFMSKAVSGGGIKGWNELPFGLGEVNRNGIARYALIVIIFAFVRFINQKKNARLLFLFPLLSALYILMQTQSRSALMGLGVVVMVVFSIKGLNWRFLFLGPAFAYAIWLAGYKWRAGGDVEKLISLTGRSYTWERGLDQILISPFFGWGFQADRLLLEFEHMHNSYLHAAIQSGLLGMLFFIGAIIGIWRLILRNNFFKKALSAGTVDRFLVIESIAVVAFLTLRSFFESTAAFYGIDLLLLVAHIGYLQAVAKSVSVPPTPT